MTTDSENPNRMTIHPVDRHVGQRIRQRRKTCGVSQETLANGLSLTFQQVQKYERGANRVSASKLYAIAQVLNVQPGWFFEGLPSDGQIAALPTTGSPVTDVLNRTDMLNLAHAMTTLPPRSQRAVILAAQATAQAIAEVSLPATERLAG